MEAQKVIGKFLDLIKHVRRAQWERDHLSSHPLDGMRVNQAQKELAEAIESMDTTQLLRFQRIITLGLLHMGKAENNQEMMIQAAKV